MKRRELLKLGGAASLSFLGRAGFSYASESPSQTFYVAVDGSDDQPGTIEHPFATLKRAQKAVRTSRTRIPEASVTVMVRRGTYYLDATLAFGPEDSGTQNAPVVYRAYPGEKVTLSGGRKLNCQWQTRKSKSICDLNLGNPGPFAFSQLFVNGKRQVRARFPDFDPTTPTGTGYITAVRALPSDTSNPDSNPDAHSVHQGVVGIEFDPATFTPKRWGNPEEALIHIFQQDDLGMLSWRIRSIDYDRNRIWLGEGGGQLGSRWIDSPSSVGKGSRFYVDNVLEEMSRPGEWYLSTASGTLYYRAEDGLDLETAVFEVPVLEEMIRAQGTDEKPVDFLSIDGFRLTHTETCYLKPFDTSPNGNWAMYRGGAVVFDQTRSCSIRNCWFDAVGGNALVWNKSNKAGGVSGCKFTECGENAICLVGSADSVQSPHAFPTDCVVQNNLIRNCGVFGKQVAGIYISRAQRITLAHNHVHSMPCAGICIDDGGPGGHIIEQNDIHDTVEETKHYGSITAFGKLRSLQGDASHPLSTSTAMPELAPAETIAIRNNLIREKTGFGVLLAGGATSYDIYDNVAVGAPICLGQGARRSVYNNILYDCDLAADFLIGGSWSDDRYHHNVAVLTGETAYLLSTAADECPPKEEIDYNCIYQKARDFAATVTRLHSDPGFVEPAGMGLTDWQRLGFDRHSTFASPLLADPTHLDFRLLAGSPALALGFRNLAISQWGPAKDFVSNWPDA